MTIVLAGKYSIERVIGRGGMGMVVAAVHQALDERVAIKLLLPDALASAETVARFQREGRAAVRIKSEHVARVLDVGTVDAGALPMQSAFGVPTVVGAPFLVMEYLEGEDLAVVLRAIGPLSVADATAYVSQAIEAIAEAHSLGIVHRDLKPANLFLTHRADGSPLVKVLDFGISKASLPGLDAAVTATSAALGSPMYMAPEQMIASRDVDGRADIWGLGVVLYQLLTSHGPFMGTTMAELCARIMQQPHPPIRQARHDVPVELEAVVARCLEKDRANRYATVADLAEALVPFGGAQATTSAERARRLIPRTERAVIVPARGNPGAAHAAMPYAATNPSWSATGASSRSSSALWVLLAVVVAALVVGAGSVLIVLAGRAHQSVVSSAVVPPPGASVVVPTIVSAELAPLTPLPSATPTAVTTQAPRPLKPVAPSPPPPKPDIF